MLKCRELGLDTPVVYGVDVDKSSSITMEFVNGVTLRDFIALHNLQEAKGLLLLSR